ncbi:cell division protein ZipA [Granulosicoccaceae sp. 1_MG-2023]|nr:cell division protein ZipA [Granulosicoccaceae sp. 1_MG-2023]
MELRWILLIIGVLLLVYIALSGNRSRRKDADYIPSHTRQQSDEPLFGDDTQDKTMSDDVDLFAQEQEPFSFDQPVDEPAAMQAPRQAADPLAAADDDLDFFTPAEKLRAETDAGEGSGGKRIFSSIAEKIDAFSARLTPRRKERMAASAARAGGDAPEQAGEEKIISVNVMAPAGALLEGAALYQVFLQRGFDYGEMGIFHSRYSGRTIFSIVNMVEPGSFDLDTIEDMQTPGVTLFLQLPGPIAADVLFEVLLSEASDMARALGATVTDSHRSTLSKQTVQHLREEIYEYMHRQKYFGGAAR